MSVISLAGGEQGLERVVAGDDEASKVGEELASNVEEDGEEVESTKAKDGVDLGDGGRLLKVVEEGVLGKLASSGQHVRSDKREGGGGGSSSSSSTKGSRGWTAMECIETYLLVELRDLVLSAVLERHDG